MSAAEQLVAAQDMACEQQPQTKSTILFVDDEQAILSSLRRLARRLGYNTVVANSGKEGLEALAQTEVDVVVSDMRMPEMTGAQFLEEAAKSHPDTLRILLTGYSDIESAISAVNKGQIFRYLSKPWQDDDLAAALEQATQIRNLQRDKARLEALTQKQNKELSELNGSLEQKVEERTKQAHEAARLLADANRDLRESYSTTVEVFANLVRQASPGSSGTRVMAIQAKSTAVALGFSEEQQENLRLAALLCDLGKLTLPDEICTIPFASLSAQQRKRFQEHPQITESILLPLPVLEPVAHIIRQHGERLDGSGFPDGLSGDAISIESRVLAVVKDFHLLRSGLLVSAVMTATEAMEYLQKYAGKRYDADVVAAFAEVVKNLEARQALAEERISIANLEPGHEVTRDFLNSHGVMVLPAGMLLTGQTIEKLKRIARAQGGESIIYVAKRRRYAEPTHC